MRVKGGGHRLYAIYNTHITEQSYAQFLLLFEYWPDTYLRQECLLYLAQDKRSWSPNMLLTIMTKDHSVMRGFQVNKEYLLVWSKRVLLLIRVFGWLLVSLPMCLCFFWGLFFGVMWPLSLVLKSLLSKSNHFWLNSTEIREQRGCGQEWRCSIVKRPRTD